MEINQPNNRRDSGVLSDARIHRKKYVCLLEMDVVVYRLTT
jgi:hypothetical protein